METILAFTTKEKVFPWGFPGGSVIKNPAANAKDTGLIPGWGRPPGEDNGHSTPVFLPGDSHGQSILVGHEVTKESDTTQRLNNNFPLGVVPSQHWCRSFSKIKDALFCHLDFA